MLKYRCSNRSRSWKTDVLWFQTNKNQCRQKHPSKYFFFMICIHKAATDKIFVIETCDLGSFLKQHSLIMFNHLLLLQFWHKQSNKSDGFNLRRCPTDEWKSNIYSHFSFVFSLPRLLSFYMQFICLQSIRWPGGWWEKWEGAKAEKSSVNWKQFAKKKIYKAPTTPMSTVWSIRQ